MLSEKPNSIDDYKNVKSDFTDYTRFEISPERRASQKAAFIEGVLVPVYKYDKLAELNFDEKLVSKKHNIYEAVQELEAAKQKPGANLAELELYAASHELRLKKIMLVEAARDLYCANNSQDMAVAQNSFESMNRMVYGEFNKNYYYEIMNTEYLSTKNFVPNNETSTRIKNELINYLEPLKSYDSKEGKLLSDDVLGRLHEFVINRYHNVLSVIPDSDDSVYYNAEQCAEIFNQTLEAGGLSKVGWEAEVNADKAGVTTSVLKRKIFLPNTTHRNSAELRRLVMHEQEVHARRGENGLATGIKLLRTGTANYTDIEEGLAMIMECAVANNLQNASFDRARDRYITAGLALGAGESMPRNARQVHEVLWRMLALRHSSGIINDADINKAEDESYAHVDNAFRGTVFWQGGVIYSKLKVYYEGLRKNAIYFSNHIDDLESTFNHIMVGKYNHTDESEEHLVQQIILEKRDKQ